MRVFWGVMLVAILGLGGAVAAAEEAVRRMITVTGTAEMNVPPDIAIVNLQVQVKKTTEAQAMNEASSRMSVLLRALGDAGVAPEDIRTNALRLSPTYARVIDGVQEAPKIAGYVAQNAVRVVLRDMNSVGNVLSTSLGEDRANGLGGISFDLADRKAAEDVVRREAMSEAIRLAALYADAAGVELGPIISINDSADFGPGPMARGSFGIAEAMSVADVPVAGGEIQITSMVQATFELLVD